MVNSNIPNETNKNVCALSMSNVLTNKYCSVIVFVKYDKSLHSIWSTNVTVGNSFHFQNLSRPLLDTLLFASNNNVVNFCIISIPGLIQNPEIPGLIRDSKYSLGFDFPVGTCVFS